MNAIDRFALIVSPHWARNRLAARRQAELLARHYEAAAAGRRTSGWSRSGGDPNAVIGGALDLLRLHARDLARNNSWGTKGLEVIANHAVSWGIVPKIVPDSAGVRARSRARAIWEEWADSPHCDYDGRNTFYGLQRLVIQAVARDGEVLIRRHVIERDLMNALGLPIPLQLQVLEADHLDTLKHSRPDGGGVILQGVEFDAQGRRVAYWLFPDHPGSNLVGIRSFGAASERVPADRVHSIYRVDRPGQVRGISWYAPVIVRLKDHDEFEDATLLRQKIAACFAAFVTDINGEALPLGAPDATDPLVDNIEPGMVKYMPVGTDVKFAIPPPVSEQAKYSVSVLRGVAAGLGIMYEQLTGDWSGVNFSSGRLGRQEFLQNLHQWRWNLLIPHFCRPTWRWAMDVAIVSGQLAETPRAKWTPPPAAMLEPDKEGLAMVRNQRGGLITGPEMLREQGYDPDEWIAEQAEWFRKLDAAGIILDSDPRKTTQAGNPREQQGTPESGQKP